MNQIFAEYLTCTRDPEQIDQIWIETLVEYALGDNFC